MATMRESTQAESPYGRKPWLKHYDFWVPSSAAYPRQPLFRALDIGASNHPDRAATIFFGAEISFRSLRDRALRLANALAEFGITRGDRVGIMLPNCPQFPIAFFAVLAVAMSIREQGMREGKSGSYLGRSVMDGSPSADTQRALGSRVGTQRY